jgi:hypothetical protein
MLRLILSLNSTSACSSRFFIRKSRGISDFEPSTPSISVRHSSNILSWTYLCSIFSTRILLLLRSGSEQVVSLWDAVSHWILWVPDVDGFVVSNLCARPLQLTTSIRAIKHLKLRVQQAKLYRSAWFSTSLEVTRTWSHTEIAADVHYQESNFHPSVFDKWEPEYPTRHPLQYTLRQ